MSNFSSFDIETCREREKKIPFAEGREVCKMLIKPRFTSKLELERKRFLSYFKLKRRFEVFSL